MRALLWGREHGVVPRLHCENAGAIQVLRERLRAAGDLGVDAHPRSRPPLVEEEGIRRALDLARLAGRRSTSCTSPLPAASRRSAGRAPTAST